MIAYIIRRLIYSVFILIGVNLLTFWLFFAVNTPDDMARMQLGAKRVTPEAIANWKADRGYNRPLLYNSAAAGGKSLTDTIYFSKSVEMFRLNFGFADDGRDIANEISRRMWRFLNALIRSTSALSLGVHSMSTRAPVLPWILPGANSMPSRPTNELSSLLFFHSRASRSPMR